MTSKRNYISIWLQISCPLFNFTSLPFLGETFESNRNCNSENSLFRPLGDGTTNIQLKKRVQTEYRSISKRNKEAKWCFTCWTQTAAGLLTNRIGKEAPSMQTPWKTIDCFPLQGGTWMSSVCIVTVVGLLFKLAFCGSLALCIISFPVSAECTVWFRLIFCSLSPVSHSIKQQHRALK